MKRSLISLGWFAFWLVLVACGSGESDVVEGPPAEIPTPGPSEYQIVVVTDDFAMGRPRVPFVIQSGVEAASGIETVQVTAFDLSQEPPAAGWSGSATSYRDYEVPYWVVYPEIPTAGLWGLAASIGESDGGTTLAQFTIQAGETSHSPALGESVPASENRTLSTEPDLSRLTSGADPIPALYELTVAEALASGRPTIVTLATPAYCQSRICAPVVRSVEAVYSEYQSQANFIHLEIYKDFQELTLADEVEEWGLTSEPWTFVIDPEGQVAARLGGPVSPRELIQSLAPLLP